MTMQRRKIISSQDLILLNEVAFASGRTYIERETIIQIAPFGVHVIDRYVNFQGWANCYILLSMEGNYSDPAEASLEISIADYNNLPFGMTIHEIGDDE